MNNLLGRKGTFTLYGETYSGEITQVHPNLTGEWWDGDMVTLTCPTVEFFTEPENVTIISEGSAK